jgi:hypothetical protein
VGIGSQYLTRARGHPLAQTAAAPQGPAPPVTIEPDARQLLGDTEQCSDSRLGRRARHLFGALPRVKAPRLISPHSARIPSAPFA